MLGMYLLSFCGINKSLITEILPNKCLTLIKTLSKKFCRLQREVRQKVLTRHKRDEKKYEGKYIVWKVINDRKFPFWTVTISKENGIWFDALSRNNFYHLCSQYFLATPVLKQIIIETSFSNFLPLLRHSASMLCPYTPFHLFFISLTWQQYPTTKCIQHQIV